MDSFEFRESDFVLLLGEGNFSFSCCLLNLMAQKHKIVQFPKFYSTCFEKSLSSSALINFNFLKTRGAEVVLGVDATKLEDDTRLNFIKFNKIIFNFPHIGGKMKINLNRALLCNFFISCTNIMASDAVVLVTLCSGQGGTEFEKKSRRWDDTWKIVEQAAQGSFVLSSIEYFPHHLFPEYHPVGYRGKEQKFSIESSVLHSFKKVDFPMRHINTESIADFAKYHVLDDCREVKVSYAHKIAIINNPLKNINSIQYFLSKKLHYFFDLNVKKIKNTEMTLPYHINYDCNKAPCFYNGCLYSLRSNLMEVLPSIAESFITEGLAFKKFESDFNSIGASCETVIGGPYRLQIMKDFFSFIVNFFKRDGNILTQNDGINWYLYYKSDERLKKKIAFHHSHLNCILIDIDSLCNFLFRVSIKELWVFQTKFIESCCTLNFPSLFPQEFSFDLSFISTDDYDEKEFFNLLHQTPDNLIKSIKLLSTYYNLETERKSYCYRINYKSFEKPLYRKLVIEIQQNVIKKLLENILHVTVL